MFILKKGHQPGVYVPLRALFLVCYVRHQMRLLMPFAIPKSIFIRQDRLN